MRSTSGHPLRGNRAARQEDIIGVAVVGSWARKNARMDSDVDLVILTQDKERYLADSSWVPAAVGERAGILRTQDWGPLTERRIVLPSGLEIEFDFAGRSWALAHPVEAGTARVTREGSGPSESISGAESVLASDTPGGDSRIPLKPTPPGRVTIPQRRLRYRVK